LLLDEISLLCYPYIGEKNQKRKRKSMKILKFFQDLMVREACSFKSQTQLLELLKGSIASKSADVIFRAFARKTGDIRDFAAIVYDEHNFSVEVRRMAGLYALAVIGDRHAGRYLLDHNWFSPENGRLAYLWGVMIYFPELRNIAEAVVRESFYQHEQEAFLECLSGC